MKILYIFSFSANRTKNCGYFLLQFNDVLEKCGGKYVRTLSIAISKFNIVYSTSFLTKKKKDDIHAMNYF